MQRTVPLFHPNCHRQIHAKGLAVSKTASRSTMCHKRIQGVIPCLSWMRGNSHVQF